MLEWFQEQKITYVQSRLDWDQARAKCQEKGGDLLSIHSEAENLRAYSLVKSAGHSNKMVWFGLKVQVMKLKVRCLHPRDVITNHSPPDSCPKE